MGRLKNDTSNSLVNRITSKFLEWAQITDDIVVKVYHGYGTSKRFIVFGHVFRLSPKRRKRYSKSIWTNTLALLRLFMVKPLPNQTVMLINEYGEDMEFKTDEDGFFRFESDLERPAEAGWHKVLIRLTPSSATGNREIAGEGLVYVPHTNEYTFVSDIDDTFLISHSSNLRKRLFVLLTENAHSRKAFDGVARHYRLLSEASTPVGQYNPFFYVSSSEWNLYDYIKDFCSINKMPPGIFLLNQLKGFSELYKTGQNKHKTKFMRIARIIETYPEQKFVLFGDDSQQDPIIYSSLVEHFPDKIKAVYLRNVHKKNEEEVRSAIEKIEKAGVHCCHFVHSKDAMEDSIRIGLIDPQEESQAQQTVDRAK